VVAERERMHTMRFVKALFTRQRPFTFIFVGINLGVFVLMWLAGGMSLTSANDEVLVGFGAKVNSLIDGQQQYWRLVTCIFIHIGLLHLLFNNYALWILGQEIEQIYGSARFVLLYVAAGLAGSLSSYVFSPNAASAGASGAIFGLFGVMGTFAIRYRKEIPDAIRRDIIRRIVPIILINLAFGFSVSIIDNAAHIGGLLGGALLALIVPYKRPGEVTTSILWRVLQASCLAVVLVSFVEAFRHYDGPRPSLSNLRVNPDSRQREEEREIGLINEAAEDFLESLRLFDAKPPVEGEIADLASSLRAAQRGIDSIEQLRASDSRNELFRQRLLDLLHEQRAIIERYNRAGLKDWNATATEERRLVQRAFDLGVLKNPEVEKTSHGAPP
jgi:rhomboid protease GluP